MEKRGKRSKIREALLSGNEAVAQGALEAGLGYASSYPGTPASEIGEALAKASKKFGIYFEWSTNEKVALEGAAGAAFSGIKALVSMKHYGLNVASDAFLPLVYLSCPLVIVVADDPGCSSSVQTEQDSRYYSKIAKVPTLEPSNSEEAKEMTKKAFDIAFKYKIPVMLRMTTRVCYSKSIVKLGKIKKPKLKGKFKKGWYKLGSKETVKRHRLLIEKLEKIRKLSETSDFNFIEKGKGKIGIITSGIAYEYVKEAMDELNIKLPLLKLGFTFPFPSEKVKKFLRNLKEVIIVEELDPIIEEEVRKINCKIKIYGKGFFPFFDELKPEIVALGIAKILKKPLPKELKENLRFKVEKRLPFFCPGCPYRSVFYAVKTVLGKQKIFAGDIGCYMLGAFKPYEMQDFIVCMGASLGISHGIAKTTNQKPVIFVGDSTFLHAGIPALINMTYNKADVLLIVLDNGVTAMTGHQPHPGTGFNALHEETKKIEIEEIVKACKADFVKVTNSFNFNQLCKDIEEAYSKKGVSVLIAKGRCRLFTIRELARKGISWPKFEIVKQKPELEKLKEFGCPAIKKENGKWVIDENLCSGCSVCKQLFPDCIRRK